MKTNVRYWIFEGDHTPQRFPLQRLVRRVRLVVDPKPETCEVTRARGYGAQIHTLDVTLSSEDKIIVPIDVLDSLTAGTEEWFYDLEARLPDVNVSFGLHDSTALFVDADPAIAARIVEDFLKVRLAGTVP